MENLVEQKQEPRLDMLDMVDQGRSAYSQAVLPTGLLDDDGKLHTDVLLREMTGHEEDILTSKKMTISYKMNLILENCIAKIGDIDKSNQNWSRYIKTLVQTDRLYLLIQLRIISLGAEFSFSIQCPACNKESNQVVNLNDFKIVGMKNPMVRTWEGILPRSKISYKCKVQTGVEEEKQEKNPNADTLSHLLLSRIFELNGRSPKLADVKSLPTLDRQHLRNELKGKEGEIDNKVEMTCPHCKNEFSSEIEVGHANFFFPSEM